MLRVRRRKCLEGDKTAVARKEKLKKRKQQIFSAQTEVKDNISLQGFNYMNTELLETTNSFIEI